MQKKLIPCLILAVVFVAAGCTNGSSTPGGGSGTDTRSQSMGNGSNNGMGGNAATTSGSTTPGSSSTYSAGGTSGATSSGTTG